ncbi:hypothetical protein NDU88_003847 [Pleurodeles waltl]|uniref:Uncharacterized protein n=1 Tax=Pleurodeles waltl TaxID=8319 RepID=A0AAV7T709_PLEWA|nr:hypothetical protein NDU88_003847 [Pleurodeles waltl]
MDETQNGCCSTNDMDSSKQALLSRLHTESGNGNPEKRLTDATSSTAITEGSTESTSVIINIGREGVPADSTVVIVDAISGSVKSGTDDSLDSIFGITFNVVVAFPAPLVLLPTSQTPPEDPIVQSDSEHVPPPKPRVYAQSLPDTCREECFSDEEYQPFCS